MTDSQRPSEPYTTVAMAEILLVQDLVQEASKVIRRLENQHPGDPRVAALRARMAERMGTGEQVQTPETAQGTDRLELGIKEGALHIQWELTEEGLALAKRRVRYSGFSIVRLFTAAPGPRGVRTTTRDFEIAHPSASLIVTGVPTPAVHTAAVGFLGRSGAFVPMARALPKSFGL